MKAVLRIVRVYNVLFLALNRLTSGQSIVSSLFLDLPIHTHRIFGSALIGRLCVGEIEVEFPRLEKSANAL